MIVITLILREVTFINEAIFEPHKNPVHRGESSYIYVHVCACVCMCVEHGQSFATVTILLNKIKITTYFENITIELYVLYTLNTHVKFHVNRILYTI